MDRKVARNNSHRGHCAHLGHPDTVRGFTHSRLRSQHFASDKNQFDFTASFKLEIFVFPSNRFRVSICREQETSCYWTDAEIDNAVHRLSFPFRIAIACNASGGVCHRIWRESSSIFTHRTSSDDRIESEYQFREGLVLCSYIAPLHLLCQGASLLHIHFEWNIQLNNRNVIKTIK